MSVSIPTYILFASHEINRAHQFELLKKELPEIQVVEPIFPNYTRIPFLSKMQSISFQRTGKSLLTSEIGVILSHRKIWQKIKNEGIDGKHYLILESDSKIVSINTINTHWKAVENKYDLFYWGAWTNNVSIKRSTRVQLNASYFMGEPLIKSVYGAYGYSINPKAAGYLLSQLKKVNYPVDLYKHYVNPNNIRIGAISPEIIHTWQTTESTIRKENLFDKLYRITRIKIFRLRNEILAYFC